MLTFKDGLKRAFESIDEIGKLAGEIEDRLAPKDNPGKNVYSSGNDKPYKHGSKSD